MDPCTANRRLRKHEKNLVVGLHSPANLLRDAIAYSQFLRVEPRANAYLFEITMKARGEIFVPPRIAYEA